MFNKFRYYRSLKRQNVIYMNELLEKACYLVDGMPDLIALAKRAKDLDIPELQKLIVEEIVKGVKANGETVAKDETVGE